MEYKITCLMCGGYGIDTDMPEISCMGCSGDGYVEVSKEEYEEYHKNSSNEQFDEIVTEQDLSCIT
jgi:hypothetical protein